MLSPDSLSIRVKTKENSAPLRVLLAMQTSAPFSVTVAFNPSFLSEPCVDCATLSRDAATTRSLVGGLQEKHGLAGFTARKLPDQMQPAPASAITAPAQTIVFAHLMASPSFRATDRK